MTGRRAPACCLLAALSIVALSTAYQRPVTAARGGVLPASPSSSEAVGQPGILVIDLPSGRTLSVVQPALTTARLAPGSVFQVVTLVAALEAGVVSPDERVSCQGRPMSPAEALANSCNDFFATVAQRLSRDALNATTTALGLGPLSAKASVASAAVGLGGVEASPEQLLRALIRATDPTGLRLRRETRDVLLEGLRGAARQGTARAIADRGIDALALAGTARLAAGGDCGLALAIFPSVHPSRAVAVVVPGGTPGDAASIAAQALAELIEGTYWEGLARRAAQSPKVPPSPLSGFPPSLRGSFGEAGGEASRKSEADPALAGLNAGRAASKSGRGTTQTPSAGMTIRVGHLRSGGYDVVQVPLEEYVARVLAGEAAARSAPAALEALAIAVRTFAIANLGRHNGDGFDLCDLTHCQVMGTATAATRQAAAATAGQILTYRGQPAAIFYTASCGGQSELPSDVWPRAQDQPFLTRHKDPDCKRLPAWTTEIATTELLRALNAAGMKGDDIRGVRVARRSGSGRAASLRIEGLDPEEITGDDLRFAVGRALGWQLIKSTAFDVKRTSSGYRFTGRGSGHGVGLCVIGSARMAADGKSAAKILAEYFPGTVISSLSVSGSR